MIKTIIAFVLVALIVSANWYMQVCLISGILLVMWGSIYRD